MNIDTRSKLENEQLPRFRILGAPIIFSSNIGVYVCYTVIFSGFHYPPLSFRIRDKSEQIKSCLQIILK